MNYGYSQDSYGFGAYNEQGNLMKRPRVFSDPSNHSTGDMATPRRTYREIETPAWFCTHDIQSSDV